ncbi:RNA exonuclease 5 isoform X2 [Gouania willdenowi]|uniref:RNA exonuclease 5 isoform X2 n=1 Tax=Gouania willdenowi TaxID=441366 RepID=UPI0010569A75|nr:RNA exonuclease 5 isoform X2 [Gouania willdenowi]
MKPQSSSLSSSSSSSSSSSPPKASAGPNNKKRKLNLSAVPEKVKRVKGEVSAHTEQSQHGSLSRPPRVSVLPDHQQQPITFQELTELLQYAALGKTGGITQPSWCRLHRQKKVRGVNIAIVEGLTQSHFYKHLLLLPHLRTKYTTRVTFTPSSDHVASDIFNSKIPKPDILVIPRADADVPNALKFHPVITTFGTQCKGLTGYLLSQEEQIKKHFPVKGMPGFEDFVCTDSIDHVTDHSPLFGLDCEMCLTEKGYELARVSLVNNSGVCVLDELVKPENRIWNYLTRFSGITAAMLRPISTTLRDIQSKLLKLLPRDAILVGHSLNNDLLALKLIHPHVIDTSLLYKKDFGQRFSLKVLAETVLKKQIQNGEKMGHNPTEDAQAALELAQYFIQTGPRQVVELHLKELWGYTVEEDSSDHTQPESAPTESFSDALQALGQSVAYYGKRDVVAMDLSNQRWYSSDKEMLKSFRDQTTCPFLSVLHFYSFSKLVKKSRPRQQQCPSVCVALQDMCVVFAGPFLAGISERKVKRLFWCCGPVRTVKMLNGVHAKVEFKLLEGAMLAVQTMNGIIVQGQKIKVRRPVHESILDLDVTLDVLMSDSLNICQLYAVKLKAREVETFSPNLSGNKAPALANGASSSETQNKHVHSITDESEMCEATLREMFAPFGAVQSVRLLSKPEKQARHAYIKFWSPDGKQAALSASEDLRIKNYLICSALTPLHLPSWVTMTTVSSGPDEIDDETTKEVTQTLKKLDRSLGKLFQSLPGSTLSVVLLLGQTRTNDDHPGLCLIEVTQEP